LVVSSVSQLGWCENPSVPHGTSEAEDRPFKRLRGLGQSRLQIIPLMGAGYARSMERVLHNKGVWIAVVVVLVIAVLLLAVYSGGGGGGLGPY